MRQPCPVHLHVISSVALTASWLQVNMVLKDLDLLFETRDAKYAAQRKAKIEATLRKSLFHG